MSRRTIVWLVAVFTMIFAFTSVSYAVTLLKPGKALKQVLGKKAEIVVETHRLKGELLDRIKGKLGGALVQFQEGSESAKVRSKTKIDFHFATKDGKKTAVAIFDEQSGKWGPVKYLIGLNLDGSVKRVVVLSYSEKRGRPIARKSFLGQYKGKNSKSEMTVGKDITGISGATISSKATTFAVNKVIVIYEEVYLNK
ncbi:MAG: FMN-binding protein [Desulfobacterales bacterium]